MLGLDGHSQDTLTMVTVQVADNLKHDHMLTGLQYFIKTIFNLRVSKGSIMNFLDWKHFFMGGEPPELCDNAVVFYRAVGEGCFSFKCCCGYLIISGFAVTCIVVDVVKYSAVVEWAWCIAVQFVMLHCLCWQNCHGERNMKCRRPLRFRRIIGSRMTFGFWLAIVDLPDDSSVASGTWHQRSLKLNWKSAVTKSRHDRCHHSD